MADFFDGSEVGEVEATAATGERIEETFRNLGFRRGVFEARQGHVQEGFDYGFHYAMMSSFCQAFTTAGSPKGTNIPVDSDDGEKDYFSCGAGSIPHFLQAKYDTILQQIQEALTSPPSQ